MGILDDVTISTEETIAENATVEDKVEEITEKDQKTDTTETIAPQIQAEEIVQSFIDTLPEDLKGDPSLKDFKDVQGLAKSYVNAQKMLGNSIRIPTEEAGEDALRQFYDKLENVPNVLKVPDGKNKEEVEQFFYKLGRPMKAEQYKYDVPEDVELNKTVVESFNKVAHSIGLTNAQANHLINFQLQKDRENFTAHQEKQTARQATMKEIWGKDFEARRNGAKIVADAFAAKYPNEVRDLVNSGQLDNPVVLTMLSDMYASMKEAGVVQGEAVRYSDTPDIARQKIKEIRENLQHPYNDKTHKDHEAAKKKMTELYRVVYSNKQDKVAG